MATHTWMLTDQIQATGFDVDINFTKFAKPANEDWLYFAALQVNFDDCGNEWAHGGLQHTGQFRQDGSLGVNWGGHRSSDGQSIGHNIRPYKWATNRWYKYIVCRIPTPSGDKGKHGWAFSILDCEAGTKESYGCVETESPFIAAAIVFLEDGYGSDVCTAPPVRVEWRNPKYHVQSGMQTPVVGKVSYNGKPCPPNSVEDQGIVEHTETQLRWYHALRVPNTTPSGERLW